MLWKKKFFIELKSSWTRKVQHNFHNENIQVAISQMWQDVAHLYTYLNWTRVWERWKRDEEKQKNMSEYGSNESSSCQTVTTDVHTWHCSKKAQHDNFINLESSVRQFSLLFIILSEHSHVRTRISTWLTCNVCEKVISLSMQTRDSLKFEWLEIGNILMLGGSSHFQYWIEMKFDLRDT